MVVVSIITPSYNSARFISESIRSVVNQTFTDWELIVVDDCSVDESVEIVNGFVRQDSRIRIIELSENSGAAVARNKGIEAAQGHYISFLDSDDLWLPHKLERQIKFMRENGAAFSCSAYEKVDDHGRFIGRVGVPDKVSYHDLLKVSTIGCLTAIYDAEKLGKIFMPSIRKRQDLGLWLRLLKKTPYAYGVPDVLAQYRVRGDSISANKRVAAQYTWRLYRDFEGLNFLKASYYFSHYALNGVLRTKLPRLARFLGVLK